MPFSVHIIVTFLVAAFFLVTGVIELALWRRFVEKFVAWGYPAYWPIVTYLLKIAGGGLAFVPSTRTIGLLLCAAISVAAIATIVIRRDATEFKAIPVNLLVLVLVGAALATR